MLCRDVLTEGKKRIKVYVFALLVCVPGAGTGLLTLAEVRYGAEVVEVPAAGFSSQGLESHGCGSGANKRPKGPERQVTKTALNHLPVFALVLL